MSVSAPLCAVFVELEAVMVTLPVVGGAVNAPAALMLPALADQVNVVLAPAALLALHCDVVLGAIIAGVQETLTPLLALEGPGLLDPHAVRKKAQADTRNSAIVRVGAKL